MDLFKGPLLTNTYSCVVINGGVLSKLLLEKLVYSLQSAITSAKKFYSYIQYICLIEATDDSNILLLEFFFIINERIIIILIKLELNYKSLLKHINIKFKIMCNCTYLYLQFQKWRFLFHYPLLSW